MHLQKTHSLMPPLKKMTDEGQLSDYCGVNISSVDDNGNFHLTQPYLIDQILKEINLRADTKLKATPAPVTILKQDEDLEDHKAHWEYRSIIVKLSFLEKCTRLDPSLHVRYTKQQDSQQIRSFPTQKPYTTGTSKGI